MRLKYEKHQRDYTLLVTSVVMEELFSKNLYYHFPFTPEPMYALIKDGILSHFITKKDYHNWSKSWLKKFKLIDLIKYEKEVNKLYIGYKIFLKSKHDNLERDLFKIHDYMRIFLPIVCIAAYVAARDNKINLKLKNELIRIRKKYEDVHKIGITLQVKLLERLENKYKIKKGTLGFLTSNEFKNFIKLKKIPKDILKRNKLIILEHSRKGEKILSKEKILKKLKEIEVQIDNKKITEIKGQVAFKGKIKGKVKIIQLISDIDSLKTGDILTTSMTDPRYLMAMKKASAIITDEGGITCHAAIVARELRKPCVIGTKIATKVLKDGDKVEVDAENGIVKVLKK